VAGLGGHDVLLARLLGSLCRAGGREVTFLRVLPRTATPSAVREARRSLSRLAADQVPFPARLEVVLSDSVSAELARHAAESDLVILGLKRLGRRRKLFGDIAPRLARESGCGVIMISRRG
jgi:nucleotide-binding universal stress UspA family protein